MSTSNRDDSSGCSAPVLGAALLARIHQLNLDYIQMLIAEYANAVAPAQSQYLPPRLRSAIAALSPSARRLLAAAPYTLYSLGLEAVSFWEGACETPAEMGTVSVVQQYARAAEESTQSVFCQIALLHAWHVAVTSQLAARVTHAMPDATGKRLVAKPLWEIRQIAIHHDALLAPRWPTNPAFWPDLVRFAAAGDTRRLATAQLLGHQLIASELEAASPATYAGGRQTIPSPRLRARKVQFEVRPRV